MPDISSLLIFPFLLVFFRFGMMVFVAPAFSDGSVNMRVRLVIALAISLIAFPMLAEDMPPLPDATALMVYYIFVELVIGLFLGIAAKLFMTVLNVGGEIIAFTSGFQAATLFDPSSGANTTAMTLYLMVCVGVLIFATNLHHVMIQGVIHSYDVFPSGKMPDLTSSVLAVIQVVQDVFRLGVQISAPVLMTGFLGNVVLGVYNRLIPQLQVFFVAMPVTITLGLLMFAFSISAILGVFMTGLSEHLTLFDIELTH